MTNPKLTKLVGSSAALVYEVIVARMVPGLAARYPTRRSQRQRDCRCERYVRACRNYETRVC